jgi:hypothetical protein
MVKNILIAMKSKNKKKLAPNKIEHLIKEIKKIGVTII